MSARLRECTDQEAQQIQLVADAKSWVRASCSAAVAVAVAPSRTVSDRYQVGGLEGVFRGHRV